MSRKRVKAVQDRTDWERLRAMSEDDIERLAIEDEDNPATVSDDEWAHATVGVVACRTPVHANFDRDVVDWFKAQGRGYQARMNAVLRRYMDAQRKAG